jgi:hypothetical protein
MISSVPTNSSVPLRECLKCLLDLSLHLGDAFFAVCYYSLMLHSYHISCPIFFC